MKKAGPKRNYCTLALLFVALSSGCGTSRQSACSHVANARCTLIKNCTNGYMINRDYSDFADCVTQQEASCITALSATGTSATPAFEETCANALADESCTTWREGRTLPECIVPPGPLVDGTPCVANGQCKSTLCFFPRDSLCGTCGEQMNAGASCQAVTSCGRDNTCVAATYLCQVPAEAGSSCGSDNPCIGGQGCVYAASGDNTGTCQPLAKTEGDTCDDRSIGIPSCDSDFGLYCNGNPGTCATVNVVEAGQACAGTVSGEACEDNATCPSSSTVPSGAARYCQAAAADGAACDTALGLPCRATSRCVWTSAQGTAGICEAANVNACTAGG
jgi:hypothetical protein